MFLCNAGKVISNPDSDILLGIVRELEDVGWGHRSRTQNLVPKLDDE